MQFNREWGTAMATTRVKSAQNCAMCFLKNKNKLEEPTAVIRTVTSLHHRFTSVDKKPCRLWHLQKHSSWFRNSLYLHVLYSQYFINCNEKKMCSIMKPAFWTTCVICILTLTIWRIRDTINLFTQFKHKLRWLF